jgi:hypothetical protein
MSPIEDARKRANLTLAEVGAAVNRTCEWVCKAEAGRIVLPPDHENKVLEAITRLARFAQSVAEAKEKLTADLHLPPTPLNGTSHGARPEGNSRRPRPTSASRNVPA